MLEEQKDLPVEAVRLGGATRSLGVLPLVTKGKVRGVLSAQSYEPYAFSPSDRRMLTEIATQAAIAIENAHLYQAEREARDLAERLRETALLISGSLELREVLELILDQLDQVIPYDSGMIHILEPDATRIIAVRDMPLDFIGRRFPLDEYPYNRRLVREEDVVVIRDMQDDPQGWVVVGDLEARANVGVSLWLRDRVIGFLAINSLEPAAFSEAEARVVQGFAQQAAIAIENARLFAEQQHRVEEASLLLEVSDAISSTLELDEILREVAVRAAQACKANRCTILLIDESSGTMVPIMSQFASGETNLRLWRRFRGASIPRYLSEIPEAMEIIRTRQPIFVPDVDVSALPKQWTEPFDVGSLLIVPLVTREHVVGMMALDRLERAQAFSAEQINLAMTIGGQAAVAIENARLYQETARRLAQTQVLREVMLAAASTLDFDRILQRTIDTLQAAMKVEFLVFALPDEEGKGLKLHPAQIGYPPAGDDFRLPIENSVCGRVFQTGEPLVLSQLDQVDFYYETSPEISSALVVPVRGGGRVIGVLNLESRRSNAYDEEDLSFYVAIAGQLGVALENARLYQDTARRLAKAQILREVSLEAASSLDFDKVLERTILALDRVLGLEYLNFMLPDEDGRTMYPHPCMLGFSVTVEEFRVPVSECITGRVYNTGQAALVPDVSADPDYAVGAEDVRSELAVPVRVGEEVMAVLNVESRSLNGFDEEDLSFYTTIAGQLGVALENARLYQQEQQRRQEAERLSRELEEKSEQLAQALYDLQDLDRLRNEVVQNVSHELRTPLTLIQGYTAFLLSGDLGPIKPAQQNALQVIDERIAVLSRLIHNLMTLRVVPRERLVFFTLSIQKVLGKSLDAYRRLGERTGVDFVVDFPPHPLSVLGDEEHLELVFSQLLDNAVKFSPEGGQISVRAWVDNGQICVAVEDQGIGIAPEHIRRIFNRFYQVDGSTTRRFGGMGIGLALVWEIVEAHQGRVDVQSQPGKGSTFTVVFPRAGE
jgi:GAF domain-containing protein/anti-sigma regulatory factor (Ser/Thr protein kinase)